MKGNTQVKKNFCACSFFCCTPYPSPRFRALALSSSLPHAGDWLTATPSPNLGLHFLGSEFGTCLRYWLGIPLTDPGQDCSLCHRSLDPFGDHAVACGGNSDRISRHNALRDVLFTAAQAAALSPRREVSSLVPGSASRPADIFVPSWVQGQPAALDVTVISPLQQLTLSQASATRGFALSFAEERKNIVHFDDCRRVGVLFVPLAVETIGGWSQSACSVIQSIGRHLGSRRGLDPHQVSMHLFQRLSVTLWRFNAHMWLSRFPSLPPDVDGLV